MKKIGLLVMPLMAVSFLASCGGGDTPPSEDVKFSVQETSVTVTNNTATLHLDWNPSGNIIEFGPFTFSLSKQSSITSSVTPGETGSRPLELTITFAGDLSSDDVGNLKFDYKDKTANKEGKGEVKGIEVLYEKPEPPVPDSWTVSIEKNSQQYGTFENEETSIEIKQYIGETSATINFYPATGYDWATFTVTAKDTRESKLTVQYTPKEDPDTPASLKIYTKDKFKAGDKVTLYFKLQTWTVSLDATSKDLGDLFYDDTHKGESITIKEYIGYESAIITFNPKDKTIDYEVTAKDKDENPLDASYAVGVPSASITLTKNEGEFEDGDMITLHLEEPLEEYTVKLSIAEGFGYFLVGTEQEQEIELNVIEGDTIAEALEAEEITPTFSVALTGEEQGKTLTGGEFDYYIDVSTQEKIYLDTQITKDINAATAHVKYNGFGLENVSDSSVSLYLENQGMGSSSKAPDDLWYTIIGDIDNPTLSELQSWTELDFDLTNGKSNLVSLISNQIVYFKGNNPNGFQQQINKSWVFRLDGETETSAKVLGHGNIMSLIDNGACATLEIPHNEDVSKCFNGVFWGFNQVDLADDFILPATKLEEGCYESMFLDCHALTKLPIFPNAIEGNVPKNAFQRMFSDCPSIITVNKNNFPIVTGEIGENSFGSMFYSFMTTSQLKDVDMSNLNPSAFGTESLFQMFSSCSKLQTLIVSFGEEDSTNWPTCSGGEVPTGNWLSNAGTSSGVTNTFIWNGETDHNALEAAGLFGDDYIHSGWTVQNPS